MGHQFIFEQVGGRCKLVEDPPFRVCSQEEILEVEGISRSKAQKAMERQKRQDAKEQDDWKMVRDFLRCKEFPSEHDVNVPKLSYWGLKRTYPLHQAAKEKKWRIMVCLMNFGANPQQKDSHGKRAIDYVKKECLQALAREQF